MLMKPPLIAFWFACAFFTLHATYNRGDLVQSCGESQYLSSFFMIFHGVYPFFSGLKSFWQMLTK
jgi:hypothetical protein